MEDIVIYTKRRYLIAMAAGSLLLVGACVYPLVYEFNISGRSLPSPALQAFCRLHYVLGYSD